MLDLEKFSLYYEGGKKILEDITLNVGDGECNLITGESGSGKSSLINSINGLALEYENAKISGKIKIDGKEINDMKLYEISMMISSVFQNPKTHFFNVDTTLELLFYLENTGLSREEMDKRMKEMLKIFPIEHLLDRNIFELSGGEKQILCVASCYISGCKMIVMDEPSSNLDNRYIEILSDMLKVLKSRGVSLIISEHRIYYLMDIVDRILLIKKGMVFRNFDKEEFVLIPGTQLSNLELRSNRRTQLLVPSKRLGENTGEGLLIKKLSCDFGKNGNLNVADISFSLGKIYGVIGKNGCGKSSFLRAMTGLEEKEKNEILFGGLRLNKRDRIKNSSLVMQDVNHQLFTDSIEEEMKLGSKNINWERIDEILSDLGLEKLRDRHPMSLSGGQKQRVAIATTMFENSKFIYFDEPTSGMDYNNMLKISMLIRKMSSSENIIFIVSHDIEFLNETADEIFNLEEYRS